ncbi:MAG: hypothetical protein EAZ81_12530 [Verrucomicrobia bacterium]|nr:MAG: hypothetical protein EAZ81_12530 [Verrucomicrobiota bacterium]
MGDSGWEGLRRRDLQSLSEITSPKLIWEVGERKTCSQQGCFAKSGSRAAAVQGPLAKVEGCERKVCFIPELARP